MVLSVMRATSKRLCSMSLMALSKSTLSGWLVFLVMGLSYLWRRNPHDDSNPTAAIKTIRYRIISLNLLGNSLTPDHSGLAGHPLHFDEARARVRRVKNRRPCYQ